ELAHEDLAVAVGDAAIGPAAAHGLVRGVEVRVVAPADRAAVDVDRERVVRARRDVDAPSDDERLRLARELRRDRRAVEPRAPNALELRDVAAIDLRERRVPLVV